MAYHDVSCCVEHVQMTRTRRGNNNFNEVDLIYYMVEGELDESAPVPDFTDADRVVYLASLFSESEIEDYLGYPLVTAAEGEYT